MDLINGLKCKTVPAIPTLDFRSATLTAERSLYWVQVENEASQVFSLDGRVWERQGPSNHEVVASPWVTKEQAETLTRQIQRLEAELQYRRVLRDIDREHARTMKRSLAEAKEQNRLLALALRNTIAYYEAQRNMRG